MTTTIRHALILVENDGSSAAIMDHALSDGDSTVLCALPIKDRDLPSTALDQTVTLQLADNIRDSWSLDT